MSLLSLVRRLPGVRLLVAMGESADGLDVYIAEMSVAYFGEGS